MSNFAPNIHNQQKRRIVPQEIQEASVQREFQNLSSQQQESQAQNTVLTQQNDKDDIVSSPQSDKLIDDIQKKLVRFDFDLKESNRVNWHKLSSQYFKTQQKGQKSGLDKIREEQSDDSQVSNQEDQESLSGASVRGLSSAGCIHDNKANDYDRNDDFIDDEEFINYYNAEKGKNKYSGFYVNRGQIEKVNDKKTEKQKKEKHNLQDKIANGEIHSKAQKRKLQIDQGSGEKKPKLNKIEKPNVIAQEYLDSQNQNKKDQLQSTIKVKDKEEKHSKHKEHKKSASKHSFKQATDKLQNLSARLDPLGVAQVDTNLSSKQPAQTPQEKEKIVKPSQLRVSSSFNQKKSQLPQKMNMAALAIQAAKDGANQQINNIQQKSNDSSLVQNEQNQKSIQLSQDGSVSESESNSGNESLNEAQDNKIQKDWRSINQENEGIKQKEVKKDPVVSLQMERVVEKIKKLVQSQGTPASQGSRKVPPKYLTRVIDRYAYVYQREVQGSSSLKALVLGMLMQHLEPFISDKRLKDKLNGVKLEDNKQILVIKDYLVKSFQAYAQEKVQKLPSDIPLDDRYNLFKEYMTNKSEDQIVTNNIYKWAHIILRQQCATSDHQRGSNQLKLIAKQFAQVFDDDQLIKDLYTNKLREKNNIQGQQRDESDIVQFSDISDKSLDKEFTSQLQSTAEKDSTTPNVKMSSHQDKLQNVNASTINTDFAQPSKKLKLEQADTALNNLRSIPSSNNQNESMPKENKFNDLNQRYLEPFMQSNTFSGADQNKLHNLQPNVSNHTQEQESITISSGSERPDIQNGTKLQVMHKQQKQQQVNQKEQKLGQEDRQDSFGSQSNNSQTQHQSQNEQYDNQEVISNINLDEQKIHQILAESAQKYRINKDILLEQNKLVTKGQNSKLDSMIFLALCMEGPNNIQMKDILQNINRKILSNQPQLQNNRKLSQRMNKAVNNRLKVHKDGKNKYSLPIFHGEQVDYGKDAQTIENNTKHSPLQQLQPKSFEQGKQTNELKAQQTIQNGPQQDRKLSINQALNSAIFLKSTPLSINNPDKLLFTTQTNKQVVRQKSPIQIQDHLKQQALCQQQQQQRLNISAPLSYTNLQSHQNQGQQQGLQQLNPYQLQNQTKNVQVVSPQDQLNQYAVLQLRNQHNSNGAINELLQGANNNNNDIIFVDEAPKQNQRIQPQNIAHTISSSQNQFNQPFVQKDYGNMGNKNGTKDSFIQAPIKEGLQHIFNNRNDPNKIIQSYQEYQQYK